MPKNFISWLRTCEYNPTIDWLIFTDDHTEYNYPSNVHVEYTTFAATQKLFQSFFDFEIFLDRPWKLCEFRPAYGEIYSKYIKNYDFWGYCDLDLFWGNIRKFITDEVLDKFDRIGFQGHSTLYRNTAEVNQRYKLNITNGGGYKYAFSIQKGVCFDENGMDAIYNEHGLPYWKEVHFAHLRKYDYNFFLGHFPAEDNYKNDRQIFVWKDGALYRKYVYDNKVYTEEFMYIHFWCRPMTYKIKNQNFNELLIYSDVVKDKTADYENVGLIKRLGRKHPVKFYLKALWFNRKKLTIKRIIFNIKGRLKLHHNR